MNSADCLLGEMKRKSFMEPQGGLGLRGNVFIHVCEIGFAHSDFTLLLGGLNGSTQHSLEADAQGLRQLRGVRER